MWCVRSFTHQRTWLFLLLLTKQWECGIFQVCVKFMFFNCLILKWNFSSQNIWIECRILSLNDIIVKWNHVTEKGISIYFFFLFNFRPQKENCGTWNQRFGRAPKVTWTHWIVWPVRCNCQACVGGTIFSLNYEAQITTPGPSCSRGWKHYLLDDSIGFGSICLLDSSIHPLNYWILVNFSLSLSQKKLFTLV